MPGIQLFETYTTLYESWFDRHHAAYESELLAVRRLLPSRGEGIEIGAGTGRFAVPLGVRFGIEPALNMAAIAKNKGTLMIRGIGEALPLRDQCFDFVLMVTTICFLDKPSKALSEACRVLRHKGVILIGFVDKESDIGKKYFKNKSSSRFYREASFYSVDEVLDFLMKAHFKKVEIIQTLFSPLDKVMHCESFKSGYGEGSFVVIKANK